MSKLQCTLISTRNIATRNDYTDAEKYKMNTYVTLKRETITIREDTVLKQKIIKKKYL